MDRVRRPHNGVKAASLLPFLLVVSLATPAGAMSVFQHYLLTPDASISPTGGSAALLSGTVEFLRGPLCLLLPTGPDCTDPPQWTANDLDLAGGGLTIARGVLEPTALIEPVFRFPILLDPVTGLSLEAIVLERELLVDNTAGQVFREIRLAPVAGATQQVVFDPATDFHPTLLSLVYQLEERVATIAFPQPPVIGLPTLESETITSLAVIELHAVVPEPSAAALLGFVVLALAGFRTHSSRR